jgi:hypothetical protein
MSSDRITAVNTNRGTGDEVRSARGQVHGGSGDFRTWQSARRVILIFLFVAVFMPRRRETLLRHEVPSLAIYGKQVCQNLSRYRQGGTIGIPFLFLFCV